MQMRDHDAAREDLPLDGPLYCTFCGEEPGSPFSKIVCHICGIHVSCCAQSSVLGHTALDIDCSQLTPLLLGALHHRWHTLSV